MSSQADLYHGLGIIRPTILLPSEEVNGTKWAVIAVDQFTSEPEYWDQVEKEVQSSPSTLRMVFPEIFLEKPGKDERIKAIHQSMKVFPSLNLCHHIEEFLRFSV